MDVEDYDDSDNEDDDNIDLAQLFSKFNIALLKDMKFAFSASEIWKYLWESSDGYKYVVIVLYLFIFLDEYFVE